MRNWMMLALDAKLRDQANDEGADDGFGAAFDEGVGEEAPTNEGANHADGEEGAGDAGAGGGTDDSGEDAGAGEGSAGDGQEGAGEAAGEGDAAASEGEAGAEGGAGEGQGDGKEGAPSPEGQRVGGDEQIPADKHAGQQQLDPATLAYMFQHLAGNRQNQQSGGQPQGQGQEGDGQQATPQQQTPKDWTEYLTDEEKQVLDKYNEEWSEVSEAEQIRVNAVARQTREQVLGEVNQALAPIVEHFQKSQVQEHFAKIKDAHEDFDELKQGPLQEWANKQTNPMIRAAAQQVLQQGSADDVIGLIDLYKRDVGAQGTGQSTGAAPDVPASSQVPAQNGGAPQVTTQQKAPPKAPPKPAANHKAASATAAVNTGSRGADPRGNDPTDFEAGFAEEVTAGN